MRNIGFVLLVVSMLLGGLAVWGLRNLSTARATPNERLGLTTVVVAARPIGFGEQLTPQYLRLQSWPRGAEPPTAFHTIAELTSQKRVALGPIAPNEPVLAGRISGPGGRATLSGVIRPGMRAAAIRVNDVVGVAGFVLPGDIVDVLITRENDQAASAGKSDMRTDVLLRSIRVLAVDQLANENKNDPVVAKAVTIEVSPEQTQQLALATQVGTLSLALRGTTDPVGDGVKDDAARTVRIEDLHLQGGGQPKLVPVAVHRNRPRAHAELPTVQIFRGSQSVSVPVLTEVAAR